MTDREKWMRRCHNLAELGRGKTGLNPVVGAVLVHEGRIIGEGWHKYFGGPHAEVEALKSVKAENKKAVSNSTLYVSLEPCSHFGKTPPCSRLILQNKIPDVVISVKDPNPLVSGRGIKQLRDAGVKVETGVLEAEGLKLIRQFLCNQQYKRPYVTLKFARSADGFVGKRGKRTPMSNSISNQLVHRMRFENDAIAVGRKTAEIDSPQLTTRNFPGKNPIRLIFTEAGLVNPEWAVFNRAAATVVVTRSAVTGMPCDHTIFEAGNSLKSTLKSLCEKLKIGSLLVEGGPHLLQNFLRANCWDELFEIVCPVSLKTGIPAPCLNGLTAAGSFHYGEDHWHHYFND